MIIFSIQTDQVFFLLSLCDKKNARASDTSKRFYPALEVISVVYDDNTYPVFVKKLLVFIKKEHIIQI